MSSILNYPQGICFSENLPKFVIVNTSSKQEVCLKKNGVTILTEEYEPYSNRIEIDFSQIIRDELTLTTPRLSSDSTVQGLGIATFTIFALGENKTFTVIKGGVLDLAVEVGVFFKENFLTHQPQLKGIRPNQPEFLTYYAGQASKVKIVGYFKDKAAETKEYISLTSGTLTSINVSYSQLVGKFSEAPSAIDVFIADSATDERISIIQRYVLMSEFHSVYSMYLFENTLGGFDTLACTGERKQKSDADFETAALEEVVSQYDVNVSFAIEQHSGMLHRLERAVLRDFIMSEQRYEFIDNGLKAIYLHKVDEKASSEDDFDDAKFTYFYSKQPQIQKSQKLLNDLPLPKGLVARDDLFFLISEAAQHAHYNIALLDALGYNDGYLLVNGKKIKAAIADVAKGCLLWGGNRFEDYMDQPVRTIDGVVHKSLSSKKFVPGFAGEGYKIDESTATFDNLVVRKQMQVYELLINKIRASNGAIWVSDSLKYEKDYGTNASAFKIGVDDKDNSRVVTFRKDDIILSQRWTGRGIRRLVLIVHAVADSGKYVECLKSSLSGATPEIGDEFVRIGNLADQDRQGALYMTASDSNAPYLDVLDGIDSDDFTNKTKVRLGRLDGITDEKMGDLSGYGLYAQNAFMRGIVHVTGGNAETKEGSQQLVQGLINSLGGLAYVDKIEKAKLGDTLIQGGYLRNELIDVVNREKNFVLSDTVFQLNEANTELSYSEGVIVHKGLAKTPLSWNIAAGTCSNLASSRYYLYVKAHKAGGNATVIANATEIPLNSVTDYYHIPLGELSAIKNGVRSINVSSGYTRIGPGEITTGVLKSPNGSDYIKLGDKNIEFCGKVVFRSSGSAVDLATWAGNTEVSIQKADSKAQKALAAAQQNVADYNAKIAAVQQQLDGEVSNWFYSYSPSLTNVPASLWKTTKEKDRHIGDTFTNTQQLPATDAGKSWRFVKNGSTYSWVQIADNDAVLALQKAAKAQSTADGKSTTYLTQPASYKEGDAWVLNSDRTINGTTYKQGEILTATQDSSVFNEGHWLKRVRYTDDTAVNNLQISSKNLAINTYVSGYKKKAGYFVVQLSEILEKGKRYTVGFDVEFVKDTGFLTALACFDASTGVNTFGSDWGYIESEGNKRYSVTLEITNSSRNILLYPQKGYVSSSSEKAGEVIFSNVAIYEGDKDLGASLSDSEKAAERKKEIEKAKQEALNAVDTVANSVTALDTEIKGAFKDSIVTDAEKKVLSEKMNVVSSQRDNIIASYTKIYTNSNLQGSAKSSLLNTKTTFSGKVDILLSTINTVISDSNITDAERAKVENAFKEYNAAYTALRKALEVASAAIQKKIKEDAEARARELDDSIKQSANSYTLFAKDKPFPVSSYNQYITDADTQGGVALRAWRGWSSSLHWKKQLNFLKIGAKYRIYIRAKFKGVIGSNGVKFGWYGGKSAYYELKSKITTSYKTIDVGVFVVNWAVSLNPYMWFLESNSFIPNDGSNESGLYIDWIRFVEADVEDITDTKIAEAKKEALEAAEAVDKELEGLKTEIQKFEKEVNGAFKDNVISTAEAKAIEKYKNTVATEKADVDAQYEKIYADGNLTGSTKTNLAAKKTAFNTAYNNLVNAIDTAIADWETTPGEKNNVDARFSAYRTDLGNLRKAFEEGIKAIEDKKISELHENIKQSINASTLLAKDKPFPASSYNEYVMDTDAQGGVALRVWRGWSSSLHWKNQLNFLKIGAKYRVYIRCKYAGSVGVDGIKFGWYNGKAGDFYLNNLITKEYKLHDVGCFTADWKVSSNPYLWFLNTNSFLPNDGSNESGLYIDWIRFVEADIEDIADIKIEEAKKESSVRNFKVRYIRDWLNGSNKNAGNHWVEIQAYRKDGSNIAQGKSVTCSTGMLNTQRVTDNNFSNYAYSTQNELSNVVVDLGAQYDDITHVKIWHYYADSRTYNETRTEVSADGKTWFPIFDSYLQGTYAESSKGHKILVNASAAIELANERIEKLRNDLDPTKQQADYLARALKKSTEVQGGLVLGSVIAARDDNGKITTYFSGNRSLNEAAYKAGVENFGTKDESHNIALNHEGTADIGDLRVEKSGAVRIYDLTTGEERFGIIKQNIQSLPELQSASVFSLSDAGNSVNLSNSEGKFIPDLSLSIPKAGGKLDVEGEMSIKVDWDTSPSGNPESVRSQVFLELYKDGVSQGSIWSYTDIALLGEDSFAKNVSIKESITAEKGVYRVKVKASILHSSGYSEVLVSLSSPKLTWKLEAQNYRKINFGLDGFFATYPDKLFYFSEQEGLVINGKVKMRGDIDIPPVVAGATVNAYGGVSNKIGTKVRDDVEYTPTGKYRVYHSIGHKNYNVDLTGSVFMYNGRPIPLLVGYHNVNNYYFDVVITKDNGKPAAGEFTYALLSKE